ncbi:MAG TPA: HTH domain-containing protein, partial [Propionibacteriaceae bacterium]|nr:HTH domain-containing protein [Propionibacteriaceae bacterium]
MTTPTKVVRPQPRSSPAVSRDSHLTLRRVERQQRLVELLGSATQPVPTSVIATRLGAAIRTVERDLARLRESGVPIATTYGPHGGSHLPRFSEPLLMELTFPEAAALIA